MLFMLLSTRGPESRGRLIPLSGFTDLFEAGQVATLTVERDELYGEFHTAPASRRPDTGADARAAESARRFRVALPNGMGENWGFLQWLLDHRHEATLTARNDANNYVLNILLPVIPWLLIFGFIWFFVFRQLRKTSAQQQSVIVAPGPGRWVPDSPENPPSPPLQTPQ
jgi:ATP-dependent Zn protease